MDLVRDQLHGWSGPHEFGLRPCSCHFFPGLPSLLHKTLRLRLPMGQLHGSLSLHVGASLVQMLAMPTDVDIAAHSMKCGICSSTVLPEQAGPGQNHCCRSQPGLSEYAASFQFSPGTSRSRPGCARNHWCRLGTMCSNFFWNAPPIP